MAVTVKKLFKKFGNFTALDNVSFTFAKGQVHGFIGPNGAGKTTTMRIMATLDLPTSGDIDICGYSILEKPELVRNRIGFVPDWFWGQKNMTVHEYLDLFARLYKIKGKERKKIIDEIEEFTNLTPLKDKYISALSRGMQQRVCLGRALINNPEVLIMDEPAANLDPRARKEFRDLVVELAKRNKGILISSHILPELQEICDSITIIDQGKILKSGHLKDYKKELKKGIKTIKIRTLEAVDKAHKFLLEQPQIHDIKIDKNTLKFEFSGTEEDVTQLLKKIVTKNIPILEFHAVDDGIEDIFMKITELNNSNGK